MSVLWLRRDPQDLGPDPYFLQDFIHWKTFLSYDLKSAGPGRAQGSGNSLQAAISLANCGLQLTLSLVGEKSAPGPEIQCFWLGRVATAGRLPFQAHALGEAVIPCFWSIGWFQKELGLLSCVPIFPAFQPSSWFLGLPGTLLINSFSNWMTPSVFILIEISTPHWCRGYLKL